MSLRGILWLPVGSVPEPGADARGEAVFGLQPAERTWIAGLRAGIREWFVVGDPVAAARLLEIVAGGRAREARLRRADLEHLIALADRDASAFVIARADAFYDRRLLACFVHEVTPADGCVAAVDFRRDALLAQEGAARTAGWSFRPFAPGETLRVVARGLRVPDGVFTGLARVNAAFLRALADAPPDCRSIENALSLLARREPVATWPVSELWQHVREGGSAREADLRLVRRKVLAGAVGVSDGIVARHLNRPLSTRISERLLSRDVKPWQVSLASFATTVVAGMSFASGHATTGGLIAQASSVLDGVDDEIATARCQESPTVSVFDALLDRISDAALIGGMTLYAWLLGGGNSAVALGFAAVAGSSLSMLVKEKYGTQFQRPWDTDREGRWRWLLLDRDGRLFLALVAGVTGWVEIVLAYLAVGTYVHAGVRMMQMRREAAA